MCYTTRLWWRGGACGQNLQTFHASFVLRRTGMNFLGGTLPNVMFIIGVLAIGLGLGIELKLVPLNKEIDKTGRIGAMVVGAILVAASLYIYLNPALMSPSQPAPATANGALAPVQAAPATNTQLIVVAPT